MKRKALILTLGVLLSALAITSCKKDKSGSTSTPELGVSIQALNTDFNLPVTAAGLKAATATSATSLVHVTSANLLVSMVNFEAELKKAHSSRDSLSIEYTWNGPKMVDLLSSTSALGSFILQPGFYDEIELRVSSVRRNMDTIPVFNLKANFTDTVNHVVPVVFTVNEPILLKTEQKNDTITTTSGSAFSGVVQIYLDQLFVNIMPADLKNAVRTNGVIVINATTNKNLYNILTANLVKRHHGEFHRHDR